MAVKVGTLQDLKKKKKKIHLHTESLEFQEVFQETQSISVQEGRLIAWELK